MCHHGIFHTYRHMHSFDTSTVSTYSTKGQIRSLDFRREVVGREWWCHPGPEQKGLGSITIKISKEAYSNFNRWSLTGKKHITGGFIFFFSPRSMGKWSNLTCAYLSHGLKPPTRKPFKNIGRQKDFQIPDPRPFRVKKLVDYGRLNQNESHTIRKTPSAFRWEIKTNQACQHVMQAIFKTFFVTYSWDLPQFTVRH